MTSVSVDDAPAVRHVRIARQGICDAGGTLIGYQVRFSPDLEGLDVGTGSVAVAGTEEAVSQVIVSTFGAFGLDTISGGRPVFIEMTRPFLTGMIPIPVPPERVVVVVPTTVRGETEVVQGLVALREAGYRIAVADDDADLSRDGLVELADFVLVDVERTPASLVPAIVARGGQHGADLIATGVSDPAAQARCLEAGFLLFQGPVLQVPAVLERRVLSASQLISTRLLRDLSDLDVPISKIEQRVAADPGLTVQLLRTANSAGAGTEARITSLRQALVLIGPLRLRSWVVLTLLDGGTAPMHEDALWVVLARAGACRTLMERSGAGQDLVDVTFTVGLLSGCAQLLGVDDVTVADAAGITGPAREALLHGSGEPGRVLTAVLAHEADDERRLAATGLAGGDVSQAYLTALRDARRMVVELSATA